MRTSVRRSDPRWTSRLGGPTSGGIRELQEEIDDARAANDLVRDERAEAELDALVQQLAEAFGLAGARVAEYDGGGPASPSAGASARRSGRRPMCIRSWVGI